MEPQSPVVQAVVEAPGEAEKAGEVELEDPGPGLVRGRVHEQAESEPCGLGTSTDDH